MLHISHTGSVSMYSSHPNCVVNGDFLNGPGQWRLLKKMERIVGRTCFVSWPVARNHRLQPPISGRLLLVRSDQHSLKWLGSKLQNVCQIGAEMSAALFKQGLVVTCNCHTKSLI